MLQNSHNLKLNLAHNRITLAVLLAKLHRSKSDDINTLNEARCKVEEVASDTHSLREIKKFTGQIRRKIKFLIHSLFNYLSKLSIS